MQVTIILDILVLPLYLVELLLSQSDLLDLGLALLNLPSSHRADRLLWPWRHFYLNAVVDGHIIVGELRKLGQGRRRLL